LKLQYSVVARVCHADMHLNADGVQLGTLPRFQHPVGLHELTCLNGDRGCIASLRRGPHTWRNIPSQNRCCHNTCIALGGFVAASDAVVCAHHTHSSSCTQKSVQNRSMACSSAREKTESRPWLVHGTDKVEDTCGLRAHIVYCMTLHCPCESSTCPVPRFVIGSRRYNSRLCYYIGRRRQDEDQLSLGPKEGRLRN
jgi:hypothetical protein